MLARLSNSSVKRMKYNLLNLPTMYVGIYITDYYFFIQIPSAFLILIFTLGLNKKINPFLCFRNFVSDIHSKTGQILSRGTGSAQQIGGG